MEKNARVEKGKTPSVVSGKPSTEISKGEAIRKGEKVESVKGAVKSNKKNVR